MLDLLGILLGQLVDLLILIFEIAYLYRVGSFIVLGPLHCHAFSTECAKVCRVRHLLVVILEEVLVRLVVFSLLFGVGLDEA